MTHNDDTPIGRVYSRREALRLLGLAGSAWLAAGWPWAGASAAATPQCIVRPEQTEGPYFVDDILNRANLITADAGQGTPMNLRIQVSEVGPAQCAPLAGARVDLWHCDARGVYSGVRDPGFDTSGESFLRGYQLTDDAGMVDFQTLYPGWYRGRTVHLHFKVRTRYGESDGQTFTSQLYFDDTLTDRVHANGPYPSSNQARTRNRQDGIYRRAGGEQLMVEALDRDRKVNASFAIGLTSA